MLHLANSDWLTDSNDQRYILYVSDDGGRGFEKLSELPGDYLHHAYGNMVVRPGGAFIAYIHNMDDEHNLEYYVSYDCGKTWPEQGKSYCAKRIRNPQAVRVRCGYILHSRSGCMNPDLPMDLVLYTSEDAIHWDEGRMLCSLARNMSYYTNNLVMNPPDGTQRVLVKSSVPYDGVCVNICHRYLTFKPKKEQSLFWTNVTMPPYERNQFLRWKAAYFCGHAAFPILQISGKMIIRRQGVANERSRIQEAEQHFAIRGSKQVTGCISNGYTDRSLLCV